MKKAFIKENSPELSLRKDEIVFVESLPVNGWVFSENMNGERGYVPFCYLEPILLPEHEISTEKVAGSMSPDANPDSVTIRRRSVTVSDSLLKEYYYCFPVMSSGAIDKPKIRSTKRSHTRSLSLQSSQSDTSCTVILTEFI